MMELDTIICGDNVEVMKTFPDACIDLVVTSPPYDNLRTYGGHSWDFPGVAAQLTRVIKPGGVIVWIVADATIDGSETGTSMRQALHFKDVCGLRLHDTMIYKTDKPPMNDNRYQSCWEFMLVFSNGKPKAFNPIHVKAIHAGEFGRGTYRQENGDLAPRFHRKQIAETRIKESIWYFPGNSLNIGHPAIFPEALARDHILSWSNEGDVVLDPFSGSGTTAKMAREAGRHYIGIDVNAEYCAIAKKRLEQRILFPIGVG